MEGIVFLLAAFVLGLVIHAFMEEKRVDDLVKKVERLEQGSAGFLPASYAYLAELEEQATKKGR